VAVTVATNILPILFAFDVLLIAIVIRDCVGADSFEAIKLTCHFADVYLLHVISPFLLLLRSNRQSVAFHFRRCTMP
jgi:hypothetical protein